MRETLRSAVLTPALPDQQVVQPAPVSWTANYLIQLVQALTTGGMVAGLVAAAWFWFSAGDLPSWWWAVCVTVLGVWATFWTIVRFHGEETGLMRAWYRAGQRSRDAEVNHLILQLQLQRDTAEEMLAGGNVTEAAEMLARANATLVNARTLLRVIYEHGPAYATREKMATLHMTQRPWERAKSLCIAAGVIGQQLQPIEPNLGVAQRRMEAYHAATVAELRRSPKSRAVWS